MKTQEWKPNVDRLVRSAMADERYCSYILDKLTIPTGNDKYTLAQLNRMWERAKQSDLTVDEFIKYQKGEL